MKKRKRDPEVLTLQGISLVALARNLPDEDIEAIQRVFKAEVLKRATKATTDKITAALPTWAVIEGFKVNTHAISGGFRGVALPVKNGKPNYASFEFKKHGLQFNAYAKKALKRLAAERLNQPYNFHEVSFRNGSFESLTRDVLRQIAPPGTDAIKMVAELIALHKTLKK